MIVYVKELEGVLTVKALEGVCKDNVELRCFVSGANVNPEDFVVVSKKDSLEDIDFEQNQVIIFEDVIEKLLANVFQEYQYNSDYYYLKNAMAAAKRPSVNTLITGSSYGLFGIDEEMLPNAVNLSLASQDLFYSIKEIYEICENNPHIENVVLCCSYYYLFSDLSKSQNKNELLRISKVYNPLFKDVHNALLLPPKEVRLLDGCIFDTNKIIDDYSMGKYRQHYFNKNRPRENFALRCWEDQSKNWIQLTEEEKEFAAKERTASHNKNQKRKITLCENTRLFQELMAFCSNRDINMVLVVTPASKYYIENMWSEFKDIFYDTINEMDGVIHLLDLYGDSRYADEDFIDTDHLSESGARKMTSDIRSILQNIN